jgi:hypothetical protein
MKYKKLAADCSPELLDMVDMACKAEQRTRANFMRFHLEKVAARIVAEHVDETTFKDLGDDEEWTHDNKQEEKEREENPSSQM